MQLGSLCFWSKTRNQWAYQTLVVSFIMRGSAIYFQDLWKRISVCCGSNSLCSGEHCRLTEQFIFAFHWRNFGGCLYHFQTNSPQTHFERFHVGSSTGFSHDWFRNQCSICTASTMALHMGHHIYKYVYRDTIKIPISYMQSMIHRYPICVYKLYTSMGYL